MADDQNANFAIATKSVVISIEYRLAITLPISASVDDCEAATMWLLENAEAEFGVRRIAVRASSAGAHLAALTLLRLRDRQVSLDPIVGVVFFFGLYDFSGTQMVRDAGPERLVLYGPTVLPTLRKLAPNMNDEERKSPSISPVYADLHSLPPALFVVGAADMLLEDSQHMEANWRAANGNSQLLQAPASPHGFDWFDTSIARKVKAFVNEWIIERLMK